MGVPLVGRRILVTGGTTGIGRATVKLLAAEGARIFTFGRDPAALGETVAETRSLAGDVQGIAADVTSREAVARVFEEADRVLGGLDILIACAALGAQPIDEMADDDWRYVVETNLVGYLACARGAIARMHPGGGQLLFVGSVSTELKVAGESVYAATKAGIQAFAETLRKEVAERNIRVGVIQPGTTNTDMQECSDAEREDALARHAMLHAQDIAEAILFVLTRPDRADVVNLRIEPRLQRTG